jgi:predicted DNA binding protein
MGLIAEFTVPAREFALETTLREVPEMIVEVERVVAHESDWIVPYLWTTGETYDEFERAAATDRTITDLVKVTDVEDAALYRVGWVVDVETVAYGIPQTGATLLSAIGKDDRWQLQIRFDDQRGTAAFQRFLRENDLVAHLSRLYEVNHPRTDGQPGLTDLQHATLVAALQAGYYETPRRISMSDLAERMGISQQALSKRLRAGHRTVIANSLTVTPPEHGVVR